VTGQAAPPRQRALVKCVVWDLDRTLLDGVYLESPDAPPAADPLLARVLADLGGRGILHAIASKNPPEAAAHAARVTGWEFAAAECGWDPKPAALARIASGLGIGIDALAFVDDDPYQRAEVEHALPQVLVLSPEDAAEAAGWPEFSPPVVTAEARRRGQFYAQRRRRQDSEREFSGSKQDFLRWARTRVTIGFAAGADVPRLRELAVRTRQFNSGEPAGAEATEAWFLSVIEAGDHDVITVRLSDRFGDDGLVGCCVAARDQAGWRTVRLLAMSCRAMGRGVIDTLLAWLARAAAREGAAGVRVGCVLTERNVPLRLALAAAGFRAGDDQVPAGGDVPGDDEAPAGSRGAMAVFSRGSGAPLPPLPGWVTVPGEPAPEPG
jgi:FkbH-like protein